MQVAVEFLGKLFQVPILEKIPISTAIVLDISLKNLEFHLGIGNHTPANFPGTSLFSGKISKKTIFQGLAKSWRTREFFREDQSFDDQRIETLSK